MKGNIFACFHRLGSSTLKTVGNSRNKNVKTERVKNKIKLFHKKRGIPRGKLVLF